jgi:hypothetical protein
MLKRKELKIAILTITVFLLYIITDSIELFQSGFSEIQLWLTYISFVGLPFSVMALYVLDSDKGGNLYLIGAVMISVSYIYFAGTSTYALAEQTSDYALLLDKLGFTYTLHGIILVIGGFLFGGVVLGKKLTHPLVGIGIIIGSLVSLVNGIFQISEIIYVVANFIRNAAFVGFGCLLFQKK